MIDFTRIANIKTLHKQAEDAMARVEAAERPMLMDWSLIADAYYAFTAFVAEKGKSPDDYTKRRQFVFIILYLFAPKVLAGGKMPTGLRDRICDVLGLNARSALSNQVKDLMFFYQEYKDFRDGVNEAYAHIEEKLGLNDGQ